MPDDVLEWLVQTVSRGMADDLNFQKRLRKRKYYDQLLLSGDGADIHAHGLEYILGAAIGSLCNHVRKVGVLASKTCYHAIRASTSDSKKSFSQPYVSPTSQSDSSST